MLAVNPVGSPRTAAESFAIGSHHIRVTAGWAEEHRRRGGTARRRGAELEEKIMEKEMRG